MQFTREDWTLFRSLNTLPQKAGTNLSRLAALVVKELADNALDAGANVRLRKDGDWVVVEDDGPGIPHERVASLFSIRRPLTSSKLLRLPQRGALGNGLRVVMGAVYASQGSFQIETDGHAYGLSPQDDGTTQATPLPVDGHRGTRIRIKLGDAIPNQADALAWAEWSAVYAHAGKPYRGKTSPWWYDHEALFEMLQAAGSAPIDDLLVHFQGIDARRARALATDWDLGRCDQAPRAQVAQIMEDLRAASKKPAPVSIGEIGPQRGYSHAKKHGEIVVNGDAQVPYCVEVYVERLSDAFGREVAEDRNDVVLVMVNRTRVTGDMYVWRQKPTEMAIRGMGVNNVFKVPKGVPLRVILSITTPFMPITTDGKDPDLKRYLDPIYECLPKAAKVFKKEVDRSRRGEVRTQQEVILRSLRASIRKASGEGRYRFSLRQLYYAVRPYVLEAFPELTEFDYNYFGKVITEYESSQGEDVPGMYRSVRGVLHIPHTHEKLPLGTKEVEQYKHNKYNINKVIYIEKEGFISLLQDEGWLDRNDCAMLTCQGFASRAARDMIDLLGAQDEEIHFYCIHDADASGTMIFDSLTEATKARPGRKVVVHDLGLNPDEGVEMGLQVESFTKKREAAYPVGRRFRHTDWERWLQGQRIELNAMDSPTFLAWLDGKFASEPGKVIPPEETLRETFAEAGEEALRDKLTERILAEAKLDERVAEAKKDLPTDLALREIVEGGLESAPESRWDRPVKDEADRQAQEIVYGKDDEGFVEGPADA